MGHGGSHSLGIPSGKGPHLVGCIDIMTDHTIQVRSNLSCERQMRHDSLKT